MKFQARAGAMREGLIPVVNVATKIKDTGDIDFGYVALRAEENDALAFACNGRAYVRQTLSDLSLNLDYLCFEQGQVTVDAESLLETVASFDPADLICIETRDGQHGQELILGLKDDPGQIQTLPCRKDQVCEQSLPSQFGKEVLIRRDVFLRGVSKALVAARNIEKHKDMFMYWMFQVSPNKARFCAGNGGMFALMDIKGTDLFPTSPSELTFYIPTKQTRAITLALSQSKDQHVFLGLSAAGDELLIRTSETEMLLRLDPTISWPPINNLLTAQPDLQVIMATADWRRLSKGCKAINDKQNRREHDVAEALVTISRVKMACTATAQSRLTSSRTASLVDYAGKLDELSIHALSPHLSEIAKLAKDSSHLQFDCRSFPKPIIVRFYAGPTIMPSDNIVRVNEALGLEESYCFIFGQLKPNVPAAEQGEQSGQAA